MKVATLVIGWKRPENLQTVLDNVKKHGGEERNIYIFIDGDVDSERKIAGREVNEKIKKCRSIAEKFSIDHKNIYCRFSDINLGCREGPRKAIDWLFSNEEVGIVLEDDVVPSPSFFGYMDKMLLTHADEPSVGAICANCFGNKGLLSSSTFRKSIFFHGWGWGTWKRIWQGFDCSIDGWQAFVHSNRFNQLDIPGFRRYWHRIYRLIEIKKLNSSWDYQFQYYLWKNRLRCCVPGVELVLYSGIGIEATHTVELCSPLQECGHLDEAALHEYPCEHSDENKAMDIFVFRNNFLPPLRVRVKRKVVRASRLFYRVTKGVIGSALRSSYRGGRG